MKKVRKGKKGTEGEGTCPQAQPALEPKSLSNAFPSGQPTSRDFSFFGQFGQAPLNAVPDNRKNLL